MENLIDGVSGTLVQQRVDWLHLDHLSSHVRGFHIAGCLRMIGCLRIAGCLRTKGYLRMAGCFRMVGCICMAGCFRINLFKKSKTTLGGIKLERHNNIWPHHLFIL